MPGTKVMSNVKTSNEQKLDEKLFQMCASDFDVIPSINADCEKESNLGQDISDQRPNNVFFLHVLPSSNTLYHQLSIVMTLLRLLGKFLR